MKAKRFLAAVAVTVLTASVAVSMTACESTSRLGKTTLNISDYVSEKNTAGYYEEKIPEVKKLITFDADELVENSYLNEDMILLNKGTEENPSYTVYSTKYEKEVVSGAKATPRIAYMSGSGTEVIEIAAENEDGTFTLKYVTLDGKEILTLNDYLTEYDVYGTDFKHYYRLSGGFAYFYVNGEVARSQVYVTTANKYGEDGLISKNNYYYRSVTDETTGEVSYEVLTVSQLSMYGPEYAAGENGNKLYYELYEYNEDKPVEGEIANYKVYAFGDTVKFYNNGTETGSLTLKNGGMLSVLDNYLYYYEMNVVDSDSKDYNVLYNVDSVYAKYNYSLYRYDILANKTKKLNYNVYIDRVYPLYNYATKSYDAAVISGYEMVDGYAVFDENEFTYVVDKDFNIAYDLHAADIGSFREIYGLGNGKYYMDRYILDENLNPVNRVSNSDIYTAQGLIRFSVNGYYGFTDYDGKIVIEPKYSSSNGNFYFVGGFAHAWERQPDGTIKEVILKTDGTVKYVEDIVKTTDKDTSKNISFGNGYYSLTTEKGDASTYEIFTYGGTLLKSFTSSENSGLHFEDSLIYEIDYKNETVTLYKIA